MNLASNLARSAEADPAAPAITFDETVVGYGMLAQGCGPGRWLAPGPRRPAR